MNSWFSAQHVTEIEKITGFRVPIGKVTDDTAMADLLLDAILACDGQVTAYAFAHQWEQFAAPVIGPDGEEVVRFAYCHRIEQLTCATNSATSISEN